jgi:hypothetical protein
MTQPVRFTLFTRSYCHLCEDMLVALEGALGMLLPGHRHDIALIDVDADPALVEKYDELVPVLVGQRPDALPVEICHYFLDPMRLAEFLGAADVSSAP